MRSFEIIYVPADSAPLALDGIISYAPAIGVDFEAPYFK